MAITDNLAGVDFSPDSPNISFFVGTDFVSPSGGQSWSVSNLGPVPELVEGDGLNGVWEATITVPQFSEAGTWRVSTVTLKDTAHNYTFLFPGDLEGTGIADDLIVIRPSLAGDGLLG